MIKKGYIGEFREFISKGNVIDLAVAVVIAGAFETIVKSLVNDMIMPIVALMFNAESLAALKLGPFTYGNFLAAVLNFLIVAFVLFMMIKAINHGKELKREKE